MINQPDGLKATHNVGVASGVCALLRLQIITPLPPSAFSRCSVFAASGQRRRSITVSLSNGLGHRGLFLACHRIQPQSLCIFWGLYFPFDKASYPSQSGKPGELRPPIDGGYGPLASILGCNTSLALVGLPVKAQIGHDSVQHQSAVDRQPKLTQTHPLSPPHLVKMIISLCFLRQ